MTTICLTQLGTSSWCGVDQAVDCGLWNVGPTPLQWPCQLAVLLAGTGKQAVVHVNPEHPKHAQRVTRLVMAEWHEKGPQHLFLLISLCVQIVINKKELCLFYVASACPYHNPTATMGHSVHNVDITANRSPTQRHTRGLRL